MTGSSRTAFVHNALNTPGSRKGTFDELCTQNPASWLQTGERLGHPDAFPASSRQPVETSRRPPCAPAALPRPALPRAPACPAVPLLPLPLGFQTLLRPVPWGAATACRTPVILASFRLPVRPFPARLPESTVNVSRLRFVCCRPRRRSRSRRDETAVLQSLKASSRSAPPPPRSPCFAGLRPARRRLPAPFAARWLLLPRTCSQATATPLCRRL